MHLLQDPALCWDCHIVYPLLPPAVRTWVRRLHEKVNEISGHISCMCMEASLYFQAVPFQVNSLHPALCHRFLFSLSYALGKATVAKDKFLSHDFFPKFQNAFIGQFVGNRKSTRQYLLKGVCCVFKGAPDHLKSALPLQAPPQTPSLSNPAVSLCFCCAFGIDQLWREVLGPLHAPATPVP